MSKSFLIDISACIDTAKVNVKHSNENATEKKAGINHEETDNTELDNQVL